MPTTDKLALPYPASNDLATVPAHMEELAEATEGHLIRAGARAYRNYVAAEHSTSSSTPVLLGTPDRIQGIELETDGLVWVMFNAISSDSTSAGGSPTLYLNESDVGLVTSTPNTSAAKTFYTTAGGFPGLIGWHGAAVTGLPVTGDAVPLRVPAGTYEISVRWKRSSGGGSISASKRHLFAWTQEFEDVSPS